MQIINDGYFSALNTTQKRPNSSTFKNGYDFWAQNLFERAMRLLKWTGPELDNVPQKELERPLLLGGTCFVTDRTPDRKVVSFPGWQCGSPTYYYDDYEDYSVHSPIFSKIFVKGKDGVMVANNSTFTSLYPLIHRYATMLAHVETTFIMRLIDERDTGGIPVASTESARSAYKTYVNNKASGLYGAVLDPAFSTLQFVDTSRTNPNTLKDFVEMRKNLLHDFYEDIGVKTAWNKKGNMIEAEVQANDSCLLLNLNDMLDSRKRGCEEINKFLGVNWTVELSEELKYDEVNEYGNSKDQGSVQDNQNE